MVSNSTARPDCVPSARSSRNVTFAAPIHMTSDIVGQHTCVPGGGSVRETLPLKKRRDQSRRASILVAASALTSLVVGDNSAQEEKKERCASENNSFASFGVADDEVNVCGKKFPQILMDVLNNEECSHMITWLPDGKAFDITKPFDLADNVLPRYFKQSQFASFVRKLNRWGFRRITRGSGTGAFFHKYFIRDKPELCKKMTCQSVKIAAGSTVMTAGRSGSSRSPSPTGENQHKVDVALMRSKTYEMLSLAQAQTAQSLDKSDPSQAKTGVGFGNTYRSMSKLTDAIEAASPMMVAPVVTSPEIGANGKTLKAGLYSALGTNHLPMAELTFPRRLMNGRMPSPLIVGNMGLAHQKAASLSLSQQINSGVLLKQAQRHRQLLRLTQQSRALLQQSKLMMQMSSNSA